MPAGQAKLAKASNEAMLQRIRAWQGPEEHEHAFLASMGPGLNSPGITVSNLANQAVYSNAADITKQLKAR